MSDTDFSGKTVLVVGGSSGIGNGMAHSFHDRGAQVHIWGTRAKASDYSLDEGSDLTGLHYSEVNVSNYNMIEQYEPSFKSLDTLVLCQGTVRYEQAEFEKKGWDEVMAVNIDSVMHCAKKFKNMLSDTQGSIIIVSSISGYSANIGNPAYAASKAGAISLTKTLGAAWARDGIRVNGIAPGLVPTKLTAATTENEKRMNASLRAIPLRRMGTPKELGAAAVFLASPLASYVQGHTLVVDGGLSLF